MKPFFQLLRKKANFEWRSQCSEALEDLKKYLFSPPLLSTHVANEEFFLYVAVSNHAVSAVLQLAKSFNKNVHPRQFLPGDLELRKVMDHKKVPGEEKLGANCEGLYKVTSALGNGTYYLADLAWKIIPRPWNIANLKKYFQ
ncbi:uncharacterized protein LOC114316710 [Camellia sinensis]|uniref:uncharacterized protein LOC114316710 n=1 Tax=Camellia sinensis TaxID=4442 RepID=UPI00103631DB|nr:uncharacterized protein LOC114316710 [Camellia sinensis]